jgi:hypothetical protein
MVMLSVRGSMVLAQATRRRAPYCRGTELSFGRQITFAAALGDIYARKLPGPAPPQAHLQPSGVSLGDSRYILEEWREVHFHLADDLLKRPHPVDLHHGQPEVLSTFPDVGGEQ